MKFAKLFLSLSLAAIAIAAQADTYALCMGVNEYPAGKNPDGTPHDYTLKGCVNDANSFKDLLTGKFSVPEGNVHMLLNKDADAEHFIEQMKWLMGTAKAGDQVVFAFSGHGASLKDDPAATTPKSYIVLADDKLVAGKLFGDLAKQLAASGVSSTFYFDSCFSGGMSRAPGVYDVRTKFREDLSARAKDLALKIKRKDLLESKPKSQATGSYTFLFASRDDQPSSDLTLGADKPSHGLFTMLFLLVVEDNPKTPVKDIIGLINGVREDLNKKLKEKQPEFEGFNQVPNLESSSEDRAAKPILIP